MIPKGEEGNRAFLSFASVFRQKTIIRQRLGQPHSVPKISLNDITKKSSE